MKKKLRNAFSLNQLRNLHLEYRSLVGNANNKHSHENSRDMLKEQTPFSDLYNTVISYKWNKRKSFKFKRCIVKLKPAESRRRGAFQFAAPSNERFH